MSAQLGRIIIYTKKLEEVGTFIASTLALKFCGSKMTGSLNLSLKGLEAIYFCTLCRPAERTAKLLSNWFSMLRMLKSFAEARKSAG